MKICSVKWENHPILGNLELNLEKRDGTPYSTVILAGENGSGKTNILDSLYSFCNFELKKSPKEVIVLGNAGKIKIRGRVYDNGTPRSYTAHFEDGHTEEWEDTREHSNHKIGEFENDPRNDGTAYSSAQAVYEVKDVSTIGTSELDKYDLKDTVKEFSPQALNQLLIDIFAQDNADYARRGESNPESENKYSQFETTSRLSRFKKAFNNFFDNGIKFDTVRINKGKHEIHFLKLDKVIPIGKLSTGEAQIVFRGGNLLRNSKNLTQGVIFIDEPEISLHPQWQKKVLSYYKGLFSHEGVIEGQLFVATHSSGVIEEAIKDPSDTLIIVLRPRPDGTIEQGGIELPAVLNYSTSAELSYQAFNISSTDYHNALYGFIEAEGWLPDFRRGKSTVIYNREVKDRTGTLTIQQQNIILSEKIRHIIHHPENTNNSYTEEELKQSIETMRSFILSKRTP